MSFPSTFTTKCPYAQLMNVRNGECHVDDINDCLRYCWTCQRYSYAIPQEAKGIFDESRAARCLVARVTSFKLKQSHHPLRLISVENNWINAERYAEYCDGCDANPDSYRETKLFFSDDVTVTLTHAGLKAAKNAEPIGHIYVRSDVDAIVGPISIAKHRSAEKLLDARFGFQGASASDGYKASLRFFRGKEHEYSNAGGRKVVPVGIVATIGISAF